MQQQPYLDTPDTASKAVFSDHGAALPTGVCAESGPHRAMLMAPVEAEVVVALRLQLLPVEPGQLPIVAIPVVVAAACVSVLIACSDTVVVSAHRGRLHPDKLLGSGSCSKQSWPETPRRPGVYSRGHSQRWDAPASTMGVPCDMSSATMKLRIWRPRSARMPSSAPSGPSAPQFQLKLSLLPSRLPSPLASLCFTL